MPEDIQSRSWLGVTVLIVLSVVVAAAASWTLYRTIDTALAQHTENLLQEGRARLTEHAAVRATRYEAVETSVAAFLLSHGTVTQQEWTAYERVVNGSIQWITGYGGMFYASRTNDGAYVVTLFAPDPLQMPLRGIDVMTVPQVATALAIAEKSGTFTLTDPIVLSDGTPVTYLVYPVTASTSSAPAAGIYLIQQASGKGQQAFSDLFNDDPDIIGTKMTASLFSDPTGIVTTNAVYAQIQQRGVSSRLEFDIPFGGRTYHTELTAPHGMAVPFNNQLLGYSVTIGSFISIVIICLTFIVIIRNRRALGRQIKEVSRAQALTLDALEDVKHAKESAEAQQQYVQTLLSSLGEGVIAFDTNGRITSLNPACEELLGRSERELLGSEVTAYIDLLKNGISAKKEERPLARLLADPAHETVRDNSFDLKRPNGTVIPISIEVAGVFKGETLTGIISTIRDITLEREVDKAKTEFASLASHQMKAPLGAIKWYLELMADSGPLTPQQKEMLAEISDADKRMLKLISSLLSVTRVESGTFAAMPELLNVAKAVHTFVSDNAPAAASREVTVHEDYAIGLPDVPMDAQLLGAIVQNLLSNAIRYTKSGGSVTVRVYSDTTMLHITVTDTGIGIPKEAMGPLWDKGFRSDEAAQMDPQGTGLGLYLVKNIIDNTGGTVAVQSEVGKGSVFTVSYPLTGMKAHAGTKSVEVPEALEPLKK